MCRIQLPSTFSKVDNSVLWAVNDNAMQCRAVLPCHHGIWTRTFKESALLNSVKSAVARSRLDYIATVVMEEWEMLE